jgi:hypothetical protein
MGITKAFHPLPFKRRGFHGLKPKFCNREMLGGIYVAVRDDVWGTIAPEMSNLNLETEQDHFKLTFEVNCRQNEIDFFWQGVITGDSQGTVVYLMSDVLRPLKGTASQATLSPTGYVTA